MPRKRRIGLDDHNNRDCREAVLLARYWAKIFGEPLLIRYGHGLVRYSIHPVPRNTEKTGDGRFYQVAYRVTPDGQVEARLGYPDFSTLLGLPPDCNGAEGSVKVTEGPTQED